MTAVSARRKPWYSGRVHHAVLPLLALGCVATGAGLAAASYSRGTAPAGTLAAPRPKVAVRLPTPAPTKVTARSGLQSAAIAQAAHPLPRSLDELLATCPTPGEIARIRGDFNLSFAPGVALPPYSCAPGGDATNPQLTLYNALRAMAALEFDAPLPLTGARNLYDWLRDLGLDGIRVVPGDDLNHAEGGTIYLPARDLATPDKRRWVDPRTGTGLAHVVATILHEARHTTPGGDRPHDCTRDGLPADSSLAFGGAWALQYWYFVWLAEHSGRWLTPYQREIARGDAARLRATRFCG